MTLPSLTLSVWSISIAPQGGRLTSMQAITGFSMTPWQHPQINSSSGCVTKSSKIPMRPTPRVAEERPGERSRLGKMEEVSSIKCHSRPPVFTRKVPLVIGEEGE
jgi:hypothetical protein